MKRAIKNLLLVSLLLTGFVAVQAQKSQYISLKGNFGQSTLLYDLENGSRKTGLGYGGELNYRFYFNEHWGFGLGVGYNTSSTEGTFDNAYSLNHVGHYDHDVVPKEPNAYAPAPGANGYAFTSVLSLDNQWKESQSVDYLNVPLFASYQGHVSDSSKLQFYVDAGVRMFLPMSSSYEVGQGSFENAGMYPDYDNLLIQGVTDRYDVTNSYRPAGELDLTYGLAATASLGFIFPVADKIDVFAGLTVDYGFTDTKNSESDLMDLDATAKMLAYRNNPTNPASVEPTYVGMANSGATGAVSPFRLGGEIGIRFCIFKEELVELPVEEIDTVVVIKEVIDTVTVVDTVVVQDTIASEVEDAMDRLRQESEGLEKLEEDTLGDGSLYGMSDKELEVLLFTIEDYPMAQTNLSDDQILLIEEKCNILKKYEHVDIKIIGHTCNTGSSSINMQVGQERAEKTKDAFVERGIDPSRIIVASYGELKPRYPNDSEKAKSLNRRVSIEVQESKK